MSFPTMVVLFDVDNTLLDNDRITADLTQYLGPGSRPGARAGNIGASSTTCVKSWGMRTISVHCSGIAWPIARLAPPGGVAFSGELSVCRPAVSAGVGRRAARQAMGPNGDPHRRRRGLSRPRKIEQSGILSVVEEQVLVYVHKEQELEDVRQRYPADHYVLIDDKLRILSAVKAQWGAQVTTVFPRQGTMPMILMRYGHFRRPISASTASAIC